MTRTEKVGFYLAIVCGILVLIGGLDMTITDRSVTGWHPGGKYSTGHEESINGPTAIIIGLAILSFPITIQIKKYIKNKRDK